MQHSFFKKESIVSLAITFILSSSAHAVSVNYACTETFSDYKGNPYTANCYIRYGQDVSHFTVLAPETFNFAVQSKGGGTKSKFTPVDGDIIIEAKPSKNGINHGNWPTTCAKGASCEFDWSGGGSNQVEFTIKEVAMIVDFGCTTDDVKLCHIPGKGDSKDLPAFSTSKTRSYDFTVSPYNCAGGHVVAKFMPKEGNILITAANGPSNKADVVQKNTQLTCSKGKTCLYDWESDFCDEVVFTVKQI